MRTRILGLELLRGLCALLVALYHVLWWSGIAHFREWGLYGVYVFFGISGAVLYHTYHGTDLSTPQFLLRRFARLAPLYGACALAPTLAGREWEGAREFLNVSMLFGFASPGQTSSVTGGWSLGIECVLYVLFPVLLTLMTSWRVTLATVAVFTALRMAFASQVMGDDLFGSFAVYTQPGAFLVFFFGGMAIAKWSPTWKGLPALGLLCAVLLFAFPGGGDRDILLGWRGLFYTLLSVVIVAGFFWTTTNFVLAGVSRFLGDASYGLYLIHPFVWSLAEGLPTLPRILTTLVGATGLAWLALRFYERPIRRLLIARLGVVKAQSHQQQQK
jgi:peptidoglycan/LPS O-acetylase OafA/YrhL